MTEESFCSTEIVAKTLHAGVKRGLRYGVHIYGKECVYMSWAVSVFLCLVACCVFGDEAASDLILDEELDPSDSLCLGVWGGVLGEGI